MSGDAIKLEEQREPSAANDQPSAAKDQVSAALKQVVEALGAAFPDVDLAVREIPEHEVVVALPAEYLHRAVSMLVYDFGIVHLSTITGDEIGEQIVLRYHFWRGAGVTLEVKVPSAEPRVVTVTDLIPGATFYEREVAEMFGVAVEGHPNLRPLLLPDDWDQGPPMRRADEAPSGGEA